MRDARAGVERVFGRAGERGEFVGDQAAAPEALARERERFAGWIRGTMANERVRKDAEKDLLAIRGARRALDAAKKEYDSTRQRQLNTRGDSAKSDEELDERRQIFESARCDLMMALQRERVGREDAGQKGGDRVLRRRIGFLPAGSGNFIDDEAKTGVAQRRVRASGS